MKDKLDITLRIADVTIGLSINPDEEQLLRDVAKEVNHAWNDWRQKFKGRNPREILAMVTLLFAKGYHVQRQQVLDTDSVLELFEQKLDDLLLRSDDI